MERVHHIADHVISETIDSETIVVNALDGSYYSLLDGASDLWLAMQAGDEVDLESLENRAILLSLVEHGLAVGDVSDEWPAYDGPAVTKFSDMEQILTLDPIHEVDEHGWPTPRPS